METALKLIAKAFLAFALLACTSCRCGGADPSPAGNAGGNNAASAAAPDWETNPGKYAVQKIKDNRLANGELVICVGNPFSSIDPQQITQSWAAPYTQLLFEGLVNLDEKQEKVLPGVAKSWEPSPDGKTWTFHLRDNAQWIGPDGNVVASVTSQDFKYAWGRCLNANFSCEYRQLFRDVQFAGVREYMKKLDAGKDPKGAKAMYDDIMARTILTPDPHTLVVKLENPSGIFLRQMAFPTFLPVYAPTVKKNGDSWTQPRNIISNGSFRFTKFDKDRVEFDRNPHYWWWTDPSYKPNGREVKHITGLTPNNVGAVYDEYTLGNVDWMGVGCTLPPKFVSNNMTDDGKPTLKDFYITPGSGRTIYIVVNSQRPAFKDTRVRQALGFAIDRAAIINKVLKQPFTPAGTMTPDGLGGFHADFPGFTHDPTRAKNLLAEAGFPGGKNFPSFTYIFRKDGLGPMVAVELQKYWGALGLTVELQPLEPKVLTGRHLSGDFEVAAAGWGMDYPDAYTFLGMFVADSPYNFAKFRDAEYDRLAWEGFTTMDPEARFNLYRQCEQKLFADASNIPILWFAISELVSPAVAGISPNSEDNHNLRYARFTYPPPGNTTAHK